jgi:hypothetical protein
VGVTDLSGWAGWAGWSIGARAALALVVVVDGGHVARQAFRSLWASNARGTISAILAGG